MSSREVQQTANLLELENFIRIQLGSNIFEPSENETYWLLQKGSYIVAEQGLTASTQGFAAVHYQTFKGRLFFRSITMVTHMIIRFERFFKKG